MIMGIDRTVSNDMEDEGNEKAEKIMRSLTKW